MPKTKLFGGSGGTAFDDQQALGNLGKIQEIRVRHGEWINGITVLYRGEDNDDLQVHGGTEGGTEDSFRLPPDTFINRIVIGYGKYIVGDWDSGLNVVVKRLQFFTDKDGRSSPVFGLGPDKDIPDEYKIEDITFENESLLSSLFGRAGEYLDALGFVYEEDPVESVVLSDVEYVKGAFDGGNKDPEVLVKLYATNHTDTEQTGSMTFKKSVSDKVTITSSHGFKEGIGFTFGTGSGAPVKAELQISFEANQSFSLGKETVHSREVTGTANTKVPPHSEIHGLLTVSSATFDAEFTAKAQIIRRSGKVETQDFSGVSRGVIATDIKEHWEKGIPISDKPPLDALHIEADGKDKVG